MVAYKRLLFYFFENLNFAQGIICITLSTIGCLLPFMVMIWKNGDRLVMANEKVSQRRNFQLIG